MTTLSLSTQSVSHLLSMSAPMGSLATAIDPTSDFPTDGAVSATHPVEYFSITLNTPALVVLRMQEANTASRCALFLSCTTPKPNANSASWRLISPEPVKQLVLHPADPAYRVGVLTIAVHYLEQSGRSHFQLRAQLRRDFFAMWLRTGEVPRAAVAGRLRGESEVPLAVGKAMSSTLHGVLTASPIGGSSSAADAAAVDAAAAPPTAATNRTGSALFTSLYVGDWHGSQREGLGFQYYAAPDDIGERDAWQGTVRLGEGEDAAASMSWGSEDRAHTAAVSPSMSSSTPGVATATAAHAGSVAAPLLLLRAFSERHNLPWSAWSIPDTVTPEELAKLGFLHSLRANAVDPASEKSARRNFGDAPSAFASVVSTNTGSPQLPSPASGHPSSPSLPPPPPASPFTTAVEGLSVLGGVIDHLVLTEIRDAELGQWVVLPVLPGVEVYAGEWAANAKEGRGVYQWLDRSYIGEWVAGRREGFGLLRRRDGGWYRGQWERHVPHGLGEARLMPGNLLYKGDWKKGCRSGRGCLTSPDGTAVHGVWAADVLLPEVHTEYADGSVYDGTWGPEGCRDGLGTLTDTAGCQHTHTWRQDSREGEGKEVYLNGVVLEGLWQDDVLVSGVYVFPNGDRYVGEMDAVLHVRHGTGTCTSADGLAVYTGGWCKDQRTGHGVFVRHAAASPLSPNGIAADKAVAERYDGAWVADKRSGTGHQEEGDHVYDGAFDKDCRDGLGVQRNTRTGSFYNGQWQASRRCGAGLYYSATKDTTYEGVFLNDRLTGTGTATRNGSAEQYSGLWVDGVEQGHGSLRLASGDTLRGVWHRGLPEAGTSVEYIDAAEKGAARDSRYVGGWEGGARHGSGTQVFRDGSVYEGAWRHNKQHGRGRRTAASSESVDCEWVDGGIAPGCVATVQFADGSLYVGPVNAAGVPHGAGVLTYPDGTVFDGHFDDGIYQL